MSENSRVYNSIDINLSPLTLYEENQSSNPDFSIIEFPPPPLKKKKKKKKKNENNPIVILMRLYSFQFLFYDK
jgi:hypothetical protein